VTARSFTAANDVTNDPEREKDDGKSPKDMKREACPGHDQYYQ
jgi:hypothetical protein